MIKRGLALSLVLGLASVAQGGAVLELRPLPSGNAGHPLGTYDPDEVATVELFLTQSPAGDDHLVRLLKLHYDDSAPELALGGHVWSYGTNGHYKDEDQAGGPPGVAIAYVGEGECSITLASCNIAEGCPDSGGTPQSCNPTGALLGPRPPSMLTLPGDGSAVKVATLEVTMPGAEGTYGLDAMNADDSSVDLKAAVSWGYACAGACNATHPDSNAPITFWRANGDLTGGTVDLKVAAPPPGCDLIASNPADSGSLWRSAKNIVRLTFNCPIPAINPGDVIIRTMPMGCAFGADLSGGFAIAVDPADPNVLKIVENGTVLTHRTWYRIETNNWAGVGDFKVDYLLQIGDCTFDKFVTPADLSCINTEAAIPGMKPDDARCDIDGNRFCTPADLSNSNSHSSGFVVPPNCPYP